MDKDFLLKTYGQCYDAESGPWNLSVRNKYLGMKYRILILCLICSCFSLTACSMEVASIWDPAIDGISWGMSIDEAISALGQKNVTISENSYGTDIKTLEKIKTVFEIDMIAVLHFDDVYPGLQTIYFECDDNYEEIKAILEEKYQGCEIITTSSSIGWQSEIVEELPDYDTIIQKYEEFNEEHNVSEEDETMLVHNFSQRTVYYVTLRDAGVLSMSGSTKVIIDMLLDGTLDID